MNIRWSQNELDKSIELHDEGYTWIQIANVLNRTEKSVKLKLSKLGYVQNKLIKKTIFNCVQCNKEFSDFIKNERKYCSQSCSAQINNVLYIKRKISNEKDNKRKRKSYYGRKSEHCINCNKLTTNKYCDNTCKAEYNRKNIFKLISENNYIGLSERVSKWCKKYLIHTFGEKCMKCGWNEKHQITNKVPIELNHIDGNSENNNLENLELLCPNCHSLTHNYKALNVGNGRAFRRERYKNGQSF